MTQPGPKPRPNLQVVREGNPGKRRRPESVKLPPAELEEPDWRDWWPVVKGRGAPGHRRARTVAAAEWRRVVQALEPVGLIAELDRSVLADLCVCVARIDECEQDITTRGVWVEGERGAVKNPSVTAANQYRSHYRFYVAEFGLAPSSRSRLGTGEGEGGDENSPFD